MTPDLPQTVALQPATDRDQPLLFRLFAEQRTRMFVAAGLDEQQVQSVLQSQFQFRSHTYSRQHPSAEDRILVTASGERIGRVLIDWSGGVGRLIDFAILGSHQGLGIGTTILQRCLEEAALRGCRLQLTVDRNSPAEHLYARMGFTVKDETPLQRQMEYSSDRRGTRG